MASSSDIYFLSMNEDMRAVLRMSKLRVIFARAWSFSLWLCFENYFNCSSFRSVSIVK